MSLATDKLIFDAATALLTGEDFDLAAAMARLSPLERRILAQEELEALIKLATPADERDARIAERDGSAA